MSGVLLPICSIFFSGVLLIVYFSKKRVNLIENKMYCCMLICSFIDSILVSIVQIIPMYGINELGRKIIEIINKADFIILILFVMALFLYTAIISSQKLKDNINQLIKILLGPSIIAIFIMLFNKIDIIKQGSNYSISGDAISIVYIICALYIVGTIGLAILNIKKADKRYIPIFSILGIIGLLFIVFKFNPYLIVISITLTFLNYIMYFTIENPDVKMLEQMELAKNEADKANRAKSDFLSSMSHEIRTPLNAIVGFSEMIKESDNLDEIHEDADDVIKASKTLLEIVNGILDISKIEAGKLEIINSPYNSKELFNEVANLMKPKMNEKALDFQIEIAEDIPTTLYGDHSNIKKVITNILSNAYKYTEKGFVKYEVRCVNNQNVSRIIISIEGTGLGLAITKQIVELMGGKVIVQSVYGSGSKFTIILDQRIEKVEVKEKKTEIDENIDLTNKNILIVDDNSLNLKVATKLIDKYNAIIDTADSGFSCIDKIKSGNKYDLILLDDMMPKMSGVETLKKLKEIPNFNTPVVVLTANAITGMREKYLSEGFDNYLAKPINKDELLKVLVRYLIDQDRTIDFGDLPKEIYEIGNNDEIDIAQPTTNEENSNEEEVEELKKEDNEKSPIDYLKENHIDIDKAIELLGDIDIYNDTLKEFIDNSSKRKTKLDEYIKTNDMDNYSIEVHSLKSDSKYLGFTSLAGIAFEHETKSKENDLKYVKDNYNDLVKELDKMIDISNKYIEM